MLACGGDMREEVDVIQRLGSELNALLEEDLVVERSLSSSSSSSPSSSQGEMEDEVEPEVSSL